MTGRILSGHRHELQLSRRRFPFSIPAIDVTGKISEEDFGPVGISLRAYVVGFALSCAFWGGVCAVLWGIG